MELYSKNKNYKLYQGSMLDMLEVIDKESIDAIITDPPYELNFMSKGWDNAGVSFNKDTWKNCFEVLKEGGHLLAFGGTRTYHRIACAIEDAGFEIRDCIMWLYGSGFPKSMNIGLAIDKKNGVESEVIGTGKSGAKETHTNSLNLVKNPFGGEYEIKKAQNEWNGWGTCLKPAYEPIIIARKPFKGSLVDNVIENGVGGFNIDECRVEAETNRRMCGTTEKSGETSFVLGAREETYTSQGRFPANVIHDGSDEVCEGFPNTKSGIRKPNGGKILNPETGWNNNSMTDKTVRGFIDSGSASRYFYCAKASKKDRDEGLDLLEEKYPASAEFRPNHMEKALKGEDGNPYGRWQPRKNIHPTVKPTELMQYLVRLVAPKGATILDPFNGSGSTGKAVMYENKERKANYNYIGIELTEEYLPIAKARIEYVINLKEEKEEFEQITFMEE